MALHKAKRDPADLITQLRDSNDRRLNDIAYYLQELRDEGRLPRPPHRPHGSRTSKDKRFTTKSRHFTIECAAYLVRKGKETLYRDLGRNRLPPTKRDDDFNNPLKLLSKRAMELVGLENDADNKNQSAVLKAHEQKPRHDVIAHVNDYFPEWEAAMIDLGREISAPPRQTRTPFEPPWRR